MSWNPLNWIPWGSDVGSIDSLQAEQDAIRQREAELDARSSARYGTAWAADVERHRAEEYQASVAQQVGGAFVEGAKEGAAAEIQFVQDTTNSVTGFTVALIPWQVWVGLAVATFVYVGGLSMLPKRILK